MPLPNQPGIMECPKCKKLFAREKLQHVEFTPTFFERLFHQRPVKLRCPECINNYNNETTP